MPISLQVRRDKFFQSPSYLWLFTFNESLQISLPYSSLLLTLWYKLSVTRVSSNDIPMLFLKADTFSLCISNESLPYPPSDAEVPAVLCAFPWACAALAGRLRCPLTRIKSPGLSINLVECRMFQSWTAVLSASDPLCDFEQVISSIWLSSFPDL